jgi:hypothetical protein
VIDAEFGRQNYGSIPRNCDWEGVEPCDIRTDPRTKLGGQMDQILVVKTNK